jgi:CBS domain-containing protein
MKVKDILHYKGTDVQTIHPEATIQQVMEVLLEHRIGSLVVCTDAGEIVGIITERDVLRECAQHSKNVRDTIVRDVMTTKLIIGALDDNLSYVMGIMTNNRIRHLPIIADHRLVGLISIGDVVKAQLEETVFENHYLREYISH